MIGRWTVLNGVLLAVVLLLGLQIARTWMRTVPPMRAPATDAADAPRREPRKRAVGERAEQTEQMVALITNQDLFDASRQALGSGPVAVAEVPPPTGIELVGIRLLGGDQEALIRDQSQQNAQRRVRAGDEVAGHTVQAINPTNVELLNPNGQAVTLWLQLAPSTGAKPGTAARPGAVAPTPRPGGVAPAAPRAGMAAGQQAPAAGQAIDPRAAERQRLRQERLQRRGGAAVRPNLPQGVQERLNQLRNGA